MRVRLQVEFPEWVELAVQRLLDHFIPPVEKVEKPRRGVTRQEFNKIMSPSRVEAEPPKPASRANHLKPCSKCGQDKPSRWITGGVCKRCRGLLTDQVADSAETFKKAKTLSDSYAAKHQRDQERFAKQSFDKGFSTEMERLPPLKKEPIPPSAHEYFPYLKLKELFGFQPFAFGIAQRSLGYSIETVAKWMSDLIDCKLCESKIDENNVAWYKLKPFVEPMMQTKEK